MTLIFAVFRSLSRAPVARMGERLAFMAHIVMRITDTSWLRVQENEHPVGRIFFSPLQFRGLYVCFRCFFFIGPRSKV